MNEATNEQLDRYLFGEMTTAEQQQFLAEAASDPELSRVLSAEQTIDGALHADRDGFPKNHAVTRQAMLALAASTPSITTTPNAEIGIVKGSTSLGKLLLGSVAVVGIVGGIVWLSNGEESQTVTPAPAVHQAPSPAVAPPQLQPPPATATENPQPEIMQQQPTNVRSAEAPPARVRNSSQTAPATEPRTEPRKGIKEPKQLPIIQGNNSKPPKPTLADPQQK